MPNEKKRSSTGLWVALILVAVILAVSVLINIGLAASLAAGSGASSHLALAARTGGRGGVDEFPQFTEEWSYGRGRAKAVRIAVDGIIARESDGGGLFGTAQDPVELVLRQIQAATKDTSVKALLVEINSPGGGVTPSDEIHAALKKFRESRRDRRVVAFARDLCASGGYYIAAAADTIVAEPTSIIGSIGVIMQSFNVNELTRKIGVADVTIKSGENKDLLNPFQPVDPAQLALLQTLVDATYGQFVRIVAEGRRLDPAEVRGLADGRVFTARECVDLKLVDRIGYVEDALAATCEALGEKQVRFVRYETRLGLLDALLQARTPPMNLQSLLPQAQTPRMMYLWRP